MDDDHVQPLLEQEDDQPSWVTLSKDAGGNNGEATADADERSSAASGSFSPWDQAAARLNNAAASQSSQLLRNNNNWSSSTTTTSRDEKEDGLPKIVLLMRLGNMGAAALLIFGSIGSFTNILSLSLSKIVLGGYGICFGTLVCCLEVNFSFLRHPIATNFGFLYSPFLRFMFYLLLGMVAWSFDSILGTVASVALGILSVMNTYVLCRYPGYRTALKEISDEEEKVLKREGRKQAWKHAVTVPWWEV